MVQQLDKYKDSERIYKIHPTEFMFTDGKELRINHIELPGWILATESSKKEWKSLPVAVNLLPLYF